MPRKKKKKKKKKTPPTETPPQRPQAHEVEAPGGPPINVPVATRSSSEGTREQSKFLQAAMAETRRTPSRRPSKVSRAGAHLTLEIAESTNNGKVRKSREFWLSQAYRGCEVGMRLFIAATLAEKGEIDWGENAAREKKNVFSRLGVSSDEQLMKKLLKIRGGQASFILINMLTDPDLKPGLIELIAEGVNPFSMVDSVTINGPMDELLVGPHVDAQECSQCLQGGPFDKSGRCVVCTQKASLVEGSIVNMADIARFSNIPI